MYWIWLLLFNLVVIPSSLAIPGLFDAAQGAADLAKYKQVKGYFRIEARIIRMQNPRGTTWNYLPCDVTNPGKCDPRITGVIDYQTPNTDFGKDSVPYSNYIKLFEGKGLSNVDISKTLTKDVCGDGTRKINVRIRAEDTGTFYRDTAVKFPVTLCAKIYNVRLSDMTTNDIIDHFDCFIYTTDPPASSERSASWTDEKTCDGHNGSHKIIWKYRWYFIPQNTCSVTAGSSSLLRQIIPIVGK